MSEELRVQIRNYLSLKDIYELLEIWKTNDRVEWADTTFDVLKELLNERIGELPPQDEPILEHEDATIDKDRLDEWETKLLDDANQPELYDTLDVLKLRDNIDKVALAVVIVYVIQGVLRFPFVSMLFQGMVVQPSEIMQSFPNMFSTTLSVGIQILIIYFPLKALAHILRILMEMEFRSRKVN